jgi:hypothetical protein
VSAEWPVKPVHPVLPGIGPRHRAALARIAELEAELALYKQARESLAAELRACRVMAAVDAERLAALEHDKARALALLRAPLEVMP